MATYNNVVLHNDFLQECVPQDALDNQLEALYTRAQKAKTKFDEFGRKMV